MNLESIPNRHEIRARRERLGVYGKSEPPEPKVAPIVLKRVAPVSVTRDWLFVATKAITVTDIQVAVSEHYGFMVSELVSHRRLGNLIRARHVAYYLSKNLTNRTLPEIGRHFEGRDHSTISHGVGRVKERLKDDCGLRLDIKRITARLERMQ